MSTIGKLERLAVVEVPQHQDDPDPPTPDELAALRSFAAEHGRCWKAELHRQWMSALANPTLHNLRNRLGPSWLAKFRLPHHLK